ncbi:MAG: hypothetical protein JNM94_02240 [Phycisphaerae bacterium]|nr:hypothetical protein [Phycisphaerae bacterium]
MPASTRTSLVLLVAISLSGTCLIACGDKPTPRPPAPATPPSKPAPAPAATPDAEKAPTTPAAAPPSTSAASAWQPVAPPAGGWKVSGQNDDPALLEVGGMKAPRPTTWTWQQPTNQFRTLQYSVPGQGESTGAAELVVSFFQGNDGGPLEPNITRWVNQFKNADGSPVTPTQSEKVVDGMPVILIELKGTYSGMSGGGPKPDQLQLGAIVMAPGGRVFLRLIGPVATVEKERENFMKMIDGAKKAS